jgi:anti-sigma regulatory factor (Ser/Thr protein kinase)
MPAPAPAPTHDQATTFHRTFCGRTDQVSQVRRDIAAYLHNCPAADDLILIADELAANAILHTQSRGRTFTVRCQLSSRTARIEVEDLGSPDAWGTQPAGTGGRTVWARLTW